MSPVCNSTRSATPPTALARNGSRAQKTTAPQPILVTALPIFVTAQPNFVAPMGTRAAPLPVPVAPIAICAALQPMSVALLGSARFAVPHSGQRPLVFPTRL